MRSSRVLILVLSLVMLFGQVAAAEDTSCVTVKAEVLKDIDDGVGLGFSSTYDPESDTAPNLISSSEDNPWSIGPIAPVSGAYTEGDTNTFTSATSAEGYIWIRNYLSNTYSVVNTSLGNVANSEQPFSNIESYGIYYPWTGSAISSIGVTSLGNSGPIDPSYGEVWNWPIKVKFDITDDWNIKAGSYKTKIINQWYYSDQDGAILSDLNDEPNEPSGFFEVLVAKALNSSIGLVLGDNWTGTSITGEPTDTSPFTLVKNSDCSLQGTFYGGLSGFQSNTTTYNKLTITPITDSTESIDIRKYIQRYSWDPTISGFSSPEFLNDSTALTSENDYEHVSELRPQESPCIIPNKFEVAIPDTDVWKIKAGLYTGSAISDFSFDDDFHAIAAANRTADISIKVPEVWDGYALSISENQKEAKPGDSMVFTHTISGFQNHSRQVTVEAHATDAGINQSHVSLATGTTENVTGSISGLSWTGTFDFNTAGQQSLLPLTWTFTPDYSYEPKTYAMEITLTHALPGSGS